MALTHLLLPSIDIVPPDGVECGHEGLLRLFCLGDEGNHVMHCVTGETKEVERTGQLSIR
eukprot:4445477-Amphidinium_carterae.2